MNRKQRLFTKSMLLLLICFTFLSFTLISYAEDVHESDLNENEIFVLGDIMTNDDETIYMSYIREYKGNEKNVIIPECINGYIITGIERNAFYHNETIETISMPNTIEYIAPSAFSSCKKLKEVKGLGGVISGAAFEDCIELESIGLSQTVSEIQGCAFSGCSSLQELTIPGSVKIIGKAAFENCKVLTNVIIENGVEEIHAEAFRGCSSLKSIFVPKSVVYIGGLAFANSGLERIEIRNDDVYIGDLAFAYTLNDLNRDLVIIGNKESSAALISKKLNLQFKDLETGEMSYLAEDQKEFCYEASRKAAKAAVEYLNEYYIDKYPQMAFEERYGNIGDRAFFTELAKKIIKEDESKTPAWAIYSWVKNNIIYSHMYSVAYPMDVYLTKSADCQGMSILLCELLRCVGVPAALSYGHSGNMTCLTYQDLSRNDIHHACVFFYENDKWMVADAAMDYYCSADEIADRFYTIEIDNIMVDNDLFSCYIWDECGVAHEGNDVYCYCYGDRKSRLGGCTKHNDDVYDIFSEGLKYEDGAEATVLDGYKGVVDFENRVIYKRYNAFFATASVIEDRGKYYYCDPQNNGIFEINGRVDLCLGHIYLKKGESVKLTPVFSSTANMYDYGEISLKVQHNDVINVDEDGCIYGVGIGYSQVYGYTEQGGRWFASIYVYEPETSIRLKNDTIIVEPGHELIVDVLSKTEAESNWKKPEPEYLHKIESTDPSTVRASYSGGEVLFVGVKEGTAIVTITSWDGGASVDYKVTVEHSIVIDEAVAATYTETGLTEGSHCSICGKIFKAREVIPMLIKNGVFRENGVINYYINGEKQTGWVKYGGEMYYFDPELGRVSGWKKIDGSYYRFSTKGVMVTGWTTYKGKYYYMKEDGSMATDWQKCGGKWYYLGADGAMKTGWQKCGGKWYYLGADGAMKTGWVQDSSKWYYMGTDGAMKTGWIQVGKKWYYFKTDGSMAANEYCKGYWLNKDGTWTTKAKASWKKNSKGWYYIDTAGWYAKRTTLTIDGKKYSFDAKGYLK